MNYIDEKDDPNDKKKENDQFNEVGDSEEDQDEAFLDDYWGFSDPRLNSELETLFQKISNNEEFAADLDKIVDSIDGRTDSAEIQSKIILLIKKLLGSDGTTSQEISKIDEKKISQYIKVISQYILHKKSLIYQELNQDIAKSKDKLEYLTAEARNNLRKSLRKFAVYEIYKIMNPHRIAVERSIDNFIHNVKLMGIKFAEKYEGGKNWDRHYPPNVIKSTKNIIKGRSR